MGDNFNRMVMLDTETSGLKPDLHQILTVDATYLTRGGGSQEWVQDGVTFQARVEFMRWARVEDSALKVNRINRATWTGLTEAAMVAALMAWVQKHAGSGYVLLAGYNVGFDRAFLEASFERARVRWTDAFSYRDLDVRQLVHWCRIMGHVKTDKLRLEDVAKELDCLDPEAHSSAADVAMTVQVMNKLLAKLTQASLF